MRILGLSIFCIALFSSTKGFGQYPNQWLVTEQKIMDFSSSPPSFMALPADFFPIWPANRNPLYVHVGSDLRGSLRYFGDYHSRSRHSEENLMFFSPSLDTLPHQLEYKSKWDMAGWEDFPSHQTLVLKNGKSFKFMTLSAVKDTFSHGLMGTRMENDTIRVSWHSNQQLGKHYSTPVYRNDSSLYHLKSLGDYNGKHVEIQCAKIGSDGTETILYNTEIKDADGLDFGHGHRVIPANRSSLVALISTQVINEETEERTYKLHFRKITDNQLSGSLASYKFDEFFGSHGTKILGSCFSSNDSFLFVSWRMLRQSLPNDILEYHFKRFSLYEKEGPLNLLDNDSTQVHNVALAPNGKIYFHHRNTDGADIEYMGVIENHEGEIPEINLAKFQEKRKENESFHYSYYAGFEPMAIVGLPMLHYSAKQQHCRDDFITCRNWSDPEFISFEWELFDQDTNLIEKTIGKTAKLSPKESGTYLVRLKGIDQHGKNSWRWAKVEYQKPYSFLADDPVIGMCAFSPYPYTIRFESDANKPSPTFRSEFYVNDTLNFTRFGDSFTIRFTKAGTYGIKIFADQDGCKDSLVLKNIQQVYTAANPGFTISKDSLCTGQSITITDASKGAVQEASYAWSDGYVDTNRSGHNRELLKIGNYRIIQKLQTGTSTSCTTSDTAFIHVMQGISKDSVPYLKLATVKDHQTIDLRWNAIDGMKHFTLNRVEGNKEFVIDGSSIPSYLDTFPDSVYLSHQYHLQAIDSCGQSSRLSNLAQTVHLTVKNENNRLTVLTWNAYRDWRSGVAQYQIESSIDGKTWHVIEGLNGLSYSDNRIKDIQKEPLYYRIKATQKDDENLVSTSNVVRVLTQTNLFIPNAFTPNSDGVNDAFAIGHFGLESFECTIFARNGQIVAFSSDPQNIWDGTSSIDDTQLPTGAYTYIVNATDVKGEDITVNGYVILIR